MAKRWDTYKGEIYSLYIVDRRSLDDVQRILKGRHNFDASTRSYRTKLEEWNMKKGKAAGQSKRKHGVNRTKGHKSASSSSSLAQTNASHPLDRNIMSSSVPLAPDSLVANTWAGHVETSGTASSGANNINLPRNDDFVVLSAGEHAGSHLDSDLTSSTSLFTAILSEEEDEVLRLLSMGTSIHNRDGYNNTPLHAAILKRNITISQSLLNYGANIDARGYQQKTPFHMAIASRPLTELLLKHSPNLSLQDDEGNTALHYVLNTKDWWENKDATSTIRSILSSGADINITNKLGESPFHRVVAFSTDSYSYIQILCGFLDRNPDLKSLMRNGMNPFTIFLNQSWEFADYRNIYSSIDRFLVAGADPNISFRSKPLFIELCSKGRFIEGSQWGKLLLSLIQKADLDITDWEGNYPLHIALKCRSEGWRSSIHAVTTALISKNVDTNQTNDKGESPLEVWLRKCYFKRSNLTNIALLLVEAGANTMKSTSDGGTLFDLLGQHPAVDQNLLIKTFLERGAVVADTQSISSPPAQWIHIWYAAWKQTRWCDAKAQLGELLYHPSQPKAKQFQDCAYIALVEHQLGLHKSALKCWHERLVGKEMVLDDYEDYCSILRDCRERGIQVDVSWYAFLLELMEFKNSGDEC